MANVLIEEQTMKDIGDAIREKTSSTDKYLPSEMPDAVRDIPSGITPTGSLSITENGTYNVTEYASAEVDVPSGHSWLNDGNTHLWLNIPSEYRTKTIRLYLYAQSNATKPVGTISWGDGTTEDISSLYDSNTVYNEHTYVEAGQYRIDIKVTSGKFSFPVTTASEEGSYLIRGVPNYANINDYSFKSIIEYVEIGNNTFFLQYNTGFMYQRAVKEIKFNSNTEYPIEPISYLFYNCISLTNIIGYSPKGVSERGFYGTHIRKVDFDSSSQTIGVNAFQTSWISELDLSNTQITTISSGAFQYVVYLREAYITMPSTLTTIAANAFSNCLASVYDFSEIHLNADGTFPCALTGTNVFYRIGVANGKIYFDSQATIDVVSQMSNWSTYSQYMEVKPQ